MNDRESLFMGSRLWERLPEFKVRQSSFLPALFVCGKNPGVVSGLLQHGAGVLWARTAQGEWSF